MTSLDFQSLFIVLGAMGYKPPVKKPGFLEKLSLYRKQKIWPCVGIWSSGFWGGGSVNQCGTKGKVSGCKLNLNHR